MQYRVTFVSDDELPEDVPWAIVLRTSDCLGPFLFVKQSCVTPAVLSEAWRAWRRYVTGDPRLPPAPWSPPGHYSIARTVLAAVNA